MTIISLFLLELIGEDSQIFCIIKIYIYLQSLDRRITYSASQPIINSLGYVPIHIKYFSNKLGGPCTGPAIKSVKATTGQTYRTWLTLERLASNSETPVDPSARVKNPEAQPG